jgi:predicted HicB family RNase H-like nuclease
LSRQLNIRIPEGLYESLRDLAAKQRVSLNQLCVALLAGAIAWKIDKEN